MEVETAEMSLRKPHDVRNPFDERIDINQNDRVELFEIEKARQAGAIPLKTQKETVELPVRTPAEREIDLNEDGRISRDQIGAFVAVLLKGPGDVNRGNRQQEFFDRNGNVFIRSTRLRNRPAGKEMAWLPRP